jgi:hypothetical protein
MLKAGGIYSNQWPLKGETTTVSGIVCTVNNCSINFLRTDNGSHNLDIYFRLLKDVQRRLQ